MEDGVPSRLGVPELSGSVLPGPLLLGAAQSDYFRRHRYPVPSVTLHDPSTLTAVQKRDRGRPVADSVETSRKDEGSFEGRGESS